MKAQSAKGKGYRLEKHLLDLLRKEVDINTSKTAGSGSGLDKGDIRIPSKEITIEAKNQKTLKIIDWWEQAKQESFYDDKPVVAFRNPRKKEFEETLVVLSLEHFIELLQEEGGEVLETMDWQQKQAQERLIRAMRDYERAMNL